MAPHANHFRFVVALLAAGAATVWAQSDPVALPKPATNPSLEQPSPLSRVSGVTQFGMPGDQKFIFCDGADCPVRSRKHLSEPRQTTALVATKVIAIEEVVDAQPAARQMSPATPIKQSTQRKARKSAKKRVNDCRATK